MSDFINEALSLYGIKNAEVTQLRHNENCTYRVDHNGQSFCLRLKKPVQGFDLTVFGGETEMLLRGELGLIETLAEQTDILVQKPVKTVSGDIVERLSDGTLVSLLSWVEGESLERVERTEEILFSAGQTLAMLRQEIEANPGLYSFPRYSYDQELIGKLVVRAEQATEYIPAKAIRSVIKALETVSCIMDEMSESDMKLICHSDPGFGNLIWTGEKIGLIDWSLSGYTYSYMDIGGLISASPDQAEQQVMLKGWESVRGKANRRYLDAYFALSVLLFVCCQYTRAKEWNDWFPTTLEYWQNTIFDPFSSGQPVQCIL